ncbi:MAG: histidine phosphatase family protein [Burkholderiales bacterium]
MDLILWRHAEAEDGVADGDRALTPKGERQARRMAKWLARRLPADTVVISSAARRARQTARALSGDFRTAAAIGIGADAKKILDAAGWPDGNDATVVIVGHQPALGRAAALALTGKAAAWRLKKGAVMWLVWRKQGGKGEAAMHAAISPDLI